MAEKELTENWCKEISPSLAVFNKAFIRRAGKGLFPYVLLDGNKEAVDYCARKEAILFYESGVYEKDEVYTDIRNGKRGVYLVERFNPNEKDIYSTLSKDGSLIFFNNGNPDHANRYDVSGCDVVSFKEAFIPMIGMDCDDGVIENVLKTYPNIWNMDISEIVNNATLCHYSHADDDTLTERDFEWLSGKPITDEDTGDDVSSMKTDSGTPEKETVRVAPENISSEGPKADIQSEKPAEKDETEMGGHSTAEAEPMEAVSDQKAETGNDTSRSENADNESGNKSSHNVKAKDKGYGITPTEDENNHKLRDAMVVEYKEVNDIIAKEKVPGMFNPVKRVIDESLETLDFSESPIKKYIDVSKDFSTDLYKRLYSQTEPLRRKFETDIKRKYKHLTCFNCSFEWDEDVTFAEGEVCTAECPKCKTKVGYEP